ncbi:IclR family transcriptional regulator [Peptoniphilus sp. GNH]|nr:transcriptional regulator, IclR family protein [Clostridiales bacterium KA00134]UHR02700.1 IclR family transcriptional regulator [Peptoniphilus sp. GNH]
MSLHKPTWRTLKVLELIDDNWDKKFNLSDISEQTSIPKSTLSPILSTLVDLNYLSLKDGKYCISFKLFQLGLSYSGDLSLLSFIKEEMESLVEDIGELSQFGILTESNVLYLEKVNSKDSIEVVSAVGKKLPAHVTSLGKAILAEMPVEKIRKIYPDGKLEKIGPNSITDFDEFLLELERIRKRGYSIEKEEASANVCCVAVPIEIDGKIKSALSVSYPSFKDCKSKTEVIAQKLLEKKKLIEKIVKIQGFKLDL